VSRAPARGTPTTTSVPHRGDSRSRTDRRRGVSDRRGCRRGSSRRSGIRHRRRRPRRSPGREHRRRRCCRVPRPRTRSPGGPGRGLSRVARTPPVAPSKRLTAPAPLPPPGAPTRRSAPAVATDVPKGRGPRGACGTPPRASRRTGRPHRHRRVPRRRRGADQHACADRGPGAEAIGPAVRTARAYPVCRSVQTAAPQRSLSDGAGPRTAAHVVTRPRDDAGLVDGGAAYLFSFEARGGVPQAPLGRVPSVRRPPPAGATSWSARPAAGVGRSGQPLRRATGGVLATLESPPRATRASGSRRGTRQHVVAVLPSGDRRGRDVGAVYRFAGTTSAGTLVDRHPSAAISSASRSPRWDRCRGRGPPRRRAGHGAWPTPRRPERRVARDLRSRSRWQETSSARPSRRKVTRCWSALRWTARQPPKAGAAYLFRRDTGDARPHLPEPGARRGDLFGAAGTLGSGSSSARPRPPGGDRCRPRSTSFDRASGNLLVTIPSRLPHRATSRQRGRRRGGEPARRAELDDTGAPDTGAAYLFDAGTGALLQRFLNPAQGAFDHFGFALAAGPPGCSSPLPVRHVSMSSGRPPGAQALRTEAVAAPAGARVAATVIVEPGEECDDGNRVDTDDCRNDCHAHGLLHPRSTRAGTLRRQRPLHGRFVRPPRPAAATVPNGRCCQSDATVGQGVSRLRRMLPLSVGLLRAGIDVPGAFPECGGPRASRPPTAGVRRSSAPARRFLGGRRPCSLPPVTR